MKMPEEIEPFMFAPCGMNCKVCYKHLAHKNSCGGCLKIGSEKPKRYEVSLMENTRLVKECGIEYFMRQQKNKYTCAKCGGIISIHDKECSECRNSGGN